MIIRTCHHPDERANYITVITLLSGYCQAVRSAAADCSHPSRGLRNFRITNRNQRLKTSLLKLLKDSVCGYKTLKAIIFKCIQKRFFLPKFAIMGIVDKNSKDLKKLCTIYNVEKMYLFGSALNSSFSKESDIDLLVKFKNIELSKYFDNYIDFKEKLELLFGREVDLVEEQTLRNPILINSINKSKELIYG